MSQQSFVEAALVPADNTILGKGFIHCLGAEHISMEQLGNCCQELSQLVFNLLLSCSESTNAWSQQLYGQCTAIVGSWAELLLLCKLNCWYDLCFIGIALWVILQYRQDICIVE